jgi:hypothetical protein
MSSPATILGPEPEDLFAAPDWAVIGLVLAVAGSFLLANSILFRHPRQLVEERFGLVRKELHSIREYIFHRAQVNLGFGFLLAGFVLQLYGRYQPVPAEAKIPVLWIGAVVLLAAVLLLASWSWSLMAFRSYVRKHFVQNPPDFEVDLALAREVGDLFSVPRYTDDTVESYLRRLSEKLGTPLSSRRPHRLDEPEDFDEGVA